MHDLGEKLIVSIDLEVDGDMELAAAHEATRVPERNIREDFGEDVEVDTHIEPLEPELPHGTDATPERVETIKAALARFAGNGAIHDIHNVRVRDTDAGEVVNFHCRAAPSMGVIKVHENVDEIERALRRAFPTVVWRMDCFAEPVIRRAFARPVARNDGPLAQNDGPSTRNNSQQPAPASEWRLRLRQSALILHDALLNRRP